MPRKGTPESRDSRRASRTPSESERAHHLAKVAHAGEHDLGGLAQTFRIADQRVGRADFFERVGD